MTKKYVILGYVLGNVGGGQLYIRNKYIFLKEKGWDVVVFGAQDRYKIMIDDLKIFEKNIIREMNYPPYVFTLKDRRRVIMTILDKASINLENSHKEDIVIESNTISGSLWGEILASEIGCKHFLYLLAESFPKLPKYILDFLNFKHKRKELTGINTKSLELLFYNYKELDDDEKYFLNALCTDVVADIPHTIIDSIDKFDFNIGCISRLQKPFVITMVDEIVYFCNNNVDKKIQLIFVGSSPEHESENRILKATNSITNLKVVFLGKLYPIPRQLFRLMDIFIGSAGSARVSLDEGVLTLAIDSLLHKPIGLLGIDTLNTLYSDYHKYDSISVALEDILIKRHFHEHYSSDDFSMYKRKTFRDEYNHHLNFINSSSKHPAYYIIPNKSIGLRMRFIKLQIFAFGITASDNFLKKAKMFAHYLNILRTRFTHSKHHPKRRVR